MDTTVTDFEQLRRMRADNPKMRERDLAQQCGVSEAELVAAFCGQSAIRISTDFSVLFPGLEALGEVLALTRNDSAVHEKVGVYDRYIKGRNASLMLGADIDMRMFPSFSTRRKEPVSTTPKLTPVTPMSASMNARRSTRRAMPASSWTSSV